MTEPDWYLYRAFLAAAQECSLSGAARVLGTTQPTMGRQIAALESALGVTLFVRSADGLVLTEAGHRLKPPAETMAAAAEAALRAVSARADEEAGTVRIAASEVMGAEVLPALLADLHAAHPLISLELVLSNRNEDLLRGDADIAVRMVRPTQEALVARKVGHIDVGLFAHSRYLEAHGMPLSLADLRQHALIGYDRDPAYLRLLSEQTGTRFSRGMFAFRSDSEIAQIGALRAGYGIGPCQAGIAARDPALVRVLPGFSLRLEVWLTMHRDVRGIHRIRLCFDALAVALEAFTAAPG